MPITAECPHCRARFSAEAHHVGRKGRCPKCKNAFEVQPVEREKVAAVDQPTPPPATHQTESDWKFEVVNDPPPIRETIQEPATTQYVNQTPPPSFRQLKGPSTVAMRFLSFVFVVLFALSFIGGLLGIIGCLALESAAMLLPSIALMAGSFSWLLIRELITFILAIERNTRETANRVAQLW